MDVFSKAGLVPKKHHRCISLESGQSSTKKSCLQKTPSDPPRFFPRRYSTPELAMRRYALRYQQRDDDVPPGQPISNKSCQTDILGLDKYLQRHVDNVSSQNESDAVSSEAALAALRAYKKPSKRPKVRSVAVHCERRRLSFAAFKGCQKFKHVYKRKISLPQPSSATTSTDDGRRRDSSVLPKLRPERTAETEKPVAANKVSETVKLPRIPTRDARPEADRPDDGNGVRTRLARLTRPQSTGSSGDGSGDRKLTAAYFRAKSAPKIYSPRFQATAPQPSDHKPLQSTPGTSDMIDTTLDMPFGRRQPVDATSTMTATTASGTRTVSTSTTFAEPGFPIVFSCESILRHPLDGGYVSHTESHRFSVHYVSAESARSSVTATSDTDGDAGPSLVFTSAGSCQNERCLTGESVSVTLGGKPDGSAASTSTTGVAGERRLIVERCTDVRRSKNDLAVDRGTGDTAADHGTFEKATNQGTIETATDRGTRETTTNCRTSETANNHQTSEPASNRQTCETATDSGTCEMTATDDDDQTVSEPPPSPPSPPSTSSPSSFSSVRYCWPVDENRNPSTNNVMDAGEGAKKLENGKHDAVRKTEEFYVLRKDEGAKAFEKATPLTAVNKTIDTLGEVGGGEEGDELELHARMDDDVDKMPLQSDERNYERLTQNHQIIESSRTVSNQSPKPDDTESVLVGRQNDLGPIESDNTHANVIEPIAAEHRGTTNTETTATEQQQSIVNNLLTVPSDRRLQSDEDTAAAEIMASRRRNEMQRSELSGRRGVADAVERNYCASQRENGQTVQSNRPQLDANKRNMPNRLDDNMSRKRNDGRDVEPRHPGYRLLQGSSSGATPAQQSNAVDRGSAAAKAMETTTVPRNSVNDHLHSYEPFEKRTNELQDGGRRCVRERDVTNNCRGCANGDAKKNVASRSEVYGTNGHDRDGGHSYDAGKNRNHESKRRLESVDEATETSKQQQQQESNYVGGSMFGDSLNCSKKPPQRYGERAEYGRGYYDNDSKKVNFSSKPDCRYDYYRSEHAPKTGGHSPRDEDCTVFADHGSHQGSTAQLPYYSHLDCKRTYGGGVDKKCTAEITDDDDDDDDDDESLTDSLEDGCKYEGTAVSYFLTLDGQKSAVTFTLKMPGTLESRLNRRQSLLKKHLHMSTMVRKSAAVRIRTRHKGCQTLWTVEKGVQVQRGSTANMDDRRALETLLAGLGRSHVSENQIRLVGGRKMVSEGNQTEHSPANRHTQTTRDVATGRETPECCAAAGRQGKNQMLAMKKFSADNALMVGVVRQNKYCKGKEALDGAKNDQLLTLSKGWINFYTLRTDSADAEAQVEFNDNDDEVKAEDDSQQYTVHVQAIPEPAVTLPVVHVPHRNNTLQFPKTSSTAAKHLPKLVQTETNNNHHCPAHLAAANGWCVSVDGPNNMHMKVSLLPEKAGTKTSEHFDLNDENKLDARRLALQRKTNYMRKPYRNLKRTQSTPRDMFSADVSRTESALSAESKYIETIDTQLLIHKARRRLSQEWDTRIQNRGLTESVQLVVTGDSVSSRTSQHYATRGHQHCSFRRQSRRI